MREKERLERKVVKDIGNKVGENELAF